MSNPIMTVTLASLLAAKAAPVKEEPPKPVFSAKGERKPNWDAAAKVLTTMRTNDGQPLPLPKDWKKDAAACAAYLCERLGDYTSKPQQSGRIIVAILHLGFVAEATRFAKNLKAALRITTDAKAGKLIVESPMSFEFNKLASSINKGAGQHVWQFHCKGDPKRSDHKPAYVHSETGQIFANVRVVPIEHANPVREALAKGFGPGAMVMVDDQIDYLPLG